MYFHASPSTSHVNTASGASTRTNVRTATAVAPSVSRVPRSSRFQTAWSVAAPSASRSAAVPTLRLALAPDRQVRGDEPLSARLVDQVDRVVLTVRAGD